MNYLEIIERRFPHLPGDGFYLKPHLPATQLGRVLASNSRIGSPSDVVAFYRYGGLFSGGSVVLTEEQVFFDGGSVRLEDVRGGSTNDKTAVLSINKGGALDSVNIKTNSADDAKRIAAVFDAIAYAPKTDVLIEKLDSYDAFSPEAINWLKLRDEVLKTVESLNQMFQDGKITLIEFEETRSRLLERL